VSVGLIKVLGDFITTLSINLMENKSIRHPQYSTTAGLLHCSNAIRPYSVNNFD